MIPERLTKFGLWFVALIVIGGTALALKYVRGYRPSLGLGFLNQDGLPADIALRFDNVRVAYREHNHVAWTLKAGRVETNRDHSRLLFSGGITANLIDAGKPRATIFSPQASYDTRQHVLDVTGHSVCHVFPKGATKSAAADDLVIEADEIIWNTGAHSVSTRGPVHATAAGDDIRGNDLSVDLQTRNMSILQFNGVFHVKEESDVLEPFKGILP